jgi:hypothetical protein
MKVETKRLRIVIEPNETVDTALDRAKHQLNLTDEQLTEYEIIFYRETAVIRNIKNEIGKAF